MRLLKKENRIILFVNYHLKLGNFMDEQKKNNEDSVEQPATHDVPPVDNTTQYGSMYGQTPYAESRPPEPGPYYHRDDYGPYAPSPYSPQHGARPVNYQKKPSCKWPVFFAVLLTASLTFLATVGIGFVLFGHAIVDGKPAQTTPPGSSSFTSPQTDQTEPSANGGRGVVVSQDGLSITFQDQEGIKDALTKFASVYNLLQDNYFEEFSDCEMVEKIIEGLAGQMGSPYTSYLTPEYYETIEDSMKGEYVGIGAIVMRDQSSQYIVNDLIPGGPAERDGLHVGDVFREIDGVDASTFEDVGQLAAFVRGEEGTDVTLIVYRSSTNEELTITLTREHITNVSVRSRMLADNIGYIHISEFSESAAKNFEKAAKELYTGGAKSFIFDLRNNGGGYAHECIGMLDVLLPPMEVATIKGRQDGKEYTDVWKTKKPAVIPEDVKFVILLNENSASASELFSGALRDLERAVIVGQQSFGKGVGSITVQLADKSAIQVTNFAYYLPNGESVEGVGLEPDFIVELPVEVSGKPISSLTLEEDTQLTKAIELLLP